MTNFEQALLQEVAALPKPHRADVLTYVCYLRISPMDDNKLERQYNTAIKNIRRTARRYHITEKVIKDGIRAGRLPKF